MADERTEKQKVQEITDKLEEGLKELFESEKYKTYLSTILDVFCSLDIVFFEKLPNDVSFTIGHLYSVYRFLLSCHNKRPS